MIVLDASAVVEMLRGGPGAEAIWQSLLDSREKMIVPHLLDVEVASAFRRLSPSEEIASGRAQQIIETLQTLPAQRCSHVPLLARIWELQHNFTSYDATYIALTEATGIDALHVRPQAC